MFWFFVREACGILAPRPGVEPAPPALEGEVLITGLPGKSCVLFFFLFFFYSPLLSSYLQLPGKGMLLPFYPLQQNLPEPLPSLVQLLSLPPLHPAPPPPSSALAWLLPMAFPPLLGGMGTWTPSG